MEADFVEISKDDYSNQIEGKSEMDMKDWRNIVKRTNELIIPGANVIFKKDIDVEKM